MEPDSVMRLQEWFVGWCRGNFGDGFHAYEPRRDPIDGTWTVRAASALGRSYEGTEITQREIFVGVMQSIPTLLFVSDGWVLVGADMGEFAWSHFWLALTFRWIGIEEEEIPTLHRTRQLEDDALQDHLRHLPLTSRTGVVEEAWAKVNGVRARAEEDHREWVTHHTVLLSHLDDARRYWAWADLARVLRNAPSSNSVEVTVDLRDGPDAFGRAFAEATQRQQD